MCQAVGKYLSINFENQANKNTWFWLRFWFKNGYYCQSDLVFKYLTFSHKEEYSCDTSDIFCLCEIAMVFSLPPFSGFNNFKVSKT